MAIEVGELEAVLRLKDEATEQFAKVWNAMVQQAATSGKSLADVTQQIVDNLGHVTDKIHENSDAMDGANAVLGGFVSKYIEARSIYALAGAAYEDLTDLIKESINTYAETETATVRLNTALNNLGHGAEDAGKEMLDLAEAFSNTTIYTKNQLTATETLLVQIGSVMPSQMSRALQATTDLASGLGVDLTTAAMLVSRAVEGNTQGLLRYGVALDKNAVQAGGLSSVLDQLESKFGGSASATLDTYAGSVSRLASEWEKTKDELGEQLLPIAEAAVKTLTALNNVVAESPKAFLALIGGVTLLASTLVGMAAWDVVKGQVAKLAAALTAELVPALASADAALEGTTVAAGTTTTALTGLAIEVGLLLASFGGGVIIGTMIDRMNEWVKTAEKGTLTLKSFGAGLLDAVLQGATGGFSKLGDYIQQTVEYFQSDNLAMETAAAGAQNLASINRQLGSSFTDLDTAIAAMQAHLNAPKGQSNFFGDLEAQGKAAADGIKIVTDAQSHYQSLLASSPALAQDVQTLYDAQKNGTLNMITYQDAATKARGQEITGIQAWIDKMKAMHPEFALNAKDMQALIGLQGDVVESNTLMTTSALDAEKTVDAAAQTGYAQRLALANDEYNKQMQLITLKGAADKNAGVERIAAERQHSAAVQAIYIEEGRMLTEEHKKTLDDIAKSDIAASTDGLQRTLQDYAVEEAAEERADILKMGSATAAATLIADTKAKFAAKSLAASDEDDAKQIAAQQDTADRIAEIVAATGRNTVAQQEAVAAAQTAAQVDHAALTIHNEKDLVATLQSIWAIAAANRTKIEVEEANKRADAIFAIEQQMVSQANQLSMSGTDLAMANIDLEEQAAIRAMLLRGNASKQEWDGTIVLYNQRRQLAQAQANTDANNVQKALFDAHAIDNAWTSTWYDSYQAWLKYFNAAYDQHHRLSEAMLSDLSEVSQALTTLGSESGTGSFGSLITSMGKSLDAGVKLGASLKTLQTQYAAINEEIANGTIDAGAASLLKLGSAAVFAAQAAAEVGQAISALNAATAQGSTAMRTLSGALSGASSGAAIGAAIGMAGGPIGAGLGAAIGAAAGALTGLLRGIFGKPEYEKVMQDVGADWGVTISTALGKQIAASEATILGGTKAQRQQWAELLNMSDIEKEAGGLNTTNLQKFETEAQGLFEVIQRGGASGQQAVSTLNDQISQFAAQADKAGGLWDPMLQNMIKQSQVLGLNLNSVTSALAAQETKLSGGLQKTVAGTLQPVIDAFTNADQFDQKLESLESTRATVQAKIDDMASRGGPSTETQSNSLLNWKDQILTLTYQIGQLNNQQHAADQTIQNFAKNGQDSFDRLSRIALASFNAIIASGGTAVDAMNQIGSSVDELISVHDKLAQSNIGVTITGNDAYNELARWRQLTKDNADLVASVGGLNDVMTALANLGGLTAETFSDLQAQGVDAFTQLTAAGFTQQEAESQLAPFLQTVLDIHQKTGEAIDDNTQKLIDQATQDGILKANQMSLNDIMMAGFAALIKAVGGEVPAAFKTMTDQVGDDMKRLPNDATTAAAGVTDAFRNLHIQPIKVPFQGDYTPPSDMPPGVDDGSGNGVPDMPAHGKGGYFDQPHVAIVGDRPEYITPTDSIGALAKEIVDAQAMSTNPSSGNVMVNVTVMGAMIKQGELEATITQAVTSQMRKNGTAKTKLLAALNA